MVKDLEKKIRAYALKNAISHEGKAQQGSVISSLFHEGLKKEEVKKNIKKISIIVKEINSLNIEEQEKEFEKVRNFVSEREVREGLEELPKVTNKGVNMRFAPSPSGPLHIGHAATACISFLYVKKYGGKFYVRIEDTNPENIYLPSYEMIEKESQWLFDSMAQVLIQSDRMKLYYDYSKKLIEKDAAYVCTCSAEDFKNFVNLKKDCPCRKLSVKDNLNRWDKMISFNKNNLKRGEAVLRFKSDMKDRNPAFRDFPLARINETPHPRQDKKYRVWPLMNLSVSVDDIEMKITHIIRAKDHRDNAKRQEMIFKALGLEKKIPWTAFLGRFKFKDMDLSTTKIRKSIEEGKYSGWDDKNLPTISSLKKQGYNPSAFWKFAERIGLSENDKVMDRKEYFYLLDYFNRDNRNKITK